jgi:hypothetical protein
VRVPNEPGGGVSAAFSDLIRLQGEFQTRLAEEALRYFRRLQGATAPASPGTVLMPNAAVELAGSAAPGTTLDLSLEIENLQRVHCVATPMLSPLVETGGTTWFPDCQACLPALVAPGEVASLHLQIPVPRSLTAGIYRGALILQGFRDGAIPVVVSISAADTSTSPSGSEKQDSTEEQPARPSRAASKNAKKSQPAARPKSNKK